MKLATYTFQGKQRVGIVVEDAIVDAEFDGDMIKLITDWDEHKAHFESLATSGSDVALSQVHLNAPISRPGKIFAIGLNYAEHIKETGREQPRGQIWFTKAQTSINGPYDPILLARNTFHNDYEVEMVAIIGKKCKHVSAKDAEKVIFGYCVGNDVTERKSQGASHQWALAKSFDTHAPIGPWITTADELGDPHNLEIKSRVNGEQRQHSNTKHMLYNVWQQIEHLSAAMTLEPGDVIFTGTPSGVGVAMDPRVFLKPGDTVVCEVEKLGSIKAVTKEE